jgi:hypothetical protein
LPGLLLELLLSAALVHYQQFCQQLSLYIGAPAQD